MAILKKLPDECLETMEVLVKKCLGRPAGLLWNIKLLQHFSQGVGRGFLFSLHPRKY